MGDGVLVLRFRVCMFYFSKDESWQTIGRGEVSSAVMFLTLDVPYLYSVFFQHLSVSVNNSQKAAWIFYTDETHQQISFVSKVSPWKPRLRKQYSHPVTHAVSLNCCKKTKGWTHVGRLCQMAAGKKVSRVPSSLNPNVRCHIRKSPPLDHILNHYITTLILLFHLRLGLPRGFTLHASFYAFFFGGGGGNCSSC